MWKLLSLRHWAHVIRKVFRVVRSPNVPMREKLLFLLPAAVYWIMPDVLPFMPVDDVAVTMLLANWFANRADRKYPQT